MRKKVNLGLQGKKMVELKTKKTVASVQAFIRRTDAKRHDDCQTVLEIMSKATGEKPVMWGTSIIGFGTYDYKYASGREGSGPVVGFSPRKQNLTLYIMAGFSDYESLLARLGKHKTGKSCLYINKLADVDLKVLAKLVEKSVKYMRKTYVTR